MTAMYRVRLSSCLPAILGAVEVHLALAESGTAVGDLELPVDETRTAIECLKHLGLTEDSRRLDGWFTAPLMRLVVSPLFPQGMRRTPAYESLVRVRRFASQLRQSSEAISASTAAEHQPSKPLAELPRQADRSMTDESSFRPAKELIDPNGYPANFGELHRVLAENPWIRTRRPTSRRTGQSIKNRLEVHAGHWVKFLALRKKRQHGSTDVLDQPAEVVAGIVADVQRRQAEERRRRVAK
jgi:hypothetical protein